MSGPGWARAFLLMMLSIWGVWGKEKVQARAFAYLTSGDSARAYLCHPAGGESLPTVLLIHEWWGLNQWVRNSAVQLAERGYTVLAVDLFHGETASDAAYAHELRTRLKPGQGAKNLDDALQALEQVPQANPNHLALVGWGLGGELALEYAQNRPVGACIVVHGRPTLRESEITALQVPVLALYGKKDRSIPPPQIRMLENALSKNPQNRFIWHETAGHGFMNPDAEVGYDEKAAEAAWDQIRAFLQENL